MNDDALHLLEEVRKIKQDVIDKSEILLQKWDSRNAKDGYQESLTNLANYMAFRSKDHRDIQNDLIPWGVSSLGRLEPNVLRSLDAVIKTLGYIVGQDQTDIDYHIDKNGENRHSELIYNTEVLLGHAPENRQTHIMVTMPSTTSYDYELVESLMTLGMNTARINCAHDDKKIWGQMISNIKKASQKTGQSCKILMDISGPKVRIKNLLTSKRNPKLKLGESFLLSTKNAMILPNNIEIAINTTVPEALENVDVGQLVKIDDGTVEAIVKSVVDEGLILEVTKLSKENGIKIKTEKGINFPDLDINLDILTEKDLKDLDFASKNADMIAFSFVKSSDDMAYIEEVLSEKLPEHKKDLPIVAKIETVEAIKAFPEIIAEAASKRPFGVMLARGDLAVEIGYERLSEIQEELLWICEAAHIPMIWATQVLESLIKNGIPTRSEISDVVAGARAECIMLNKGDYIIEGVKTVDDILSKSEGHNYKKTARLRALNISKNLFN